ncbi:Protein kinase-like domain [Pseudocohnilembus persalinus]|uniref:Protein kinase-like domain n=1 Tax=Pseudocohnilembus persalinus TaxID=266149 RepID=A0A0V0QTZ7_PSEPJ|nr:Protein kinase-like domain [Pseudocohnilembus persalinus]|eukprot:KRX05400.1 Protein kinase-like domain [Pseudocohnilembus persalinus]
MDLPPNAVLNKKYQIQELIGLGSFGVIYKAINIETKELLAIKVIEQILEDENEAAFNYFKFEVKITKKIKSENVVKFLDYFEDLQYCYLCLEFCQDGDLKTYIQKQKNKHLSEKEAIFYFKQLLVGFKPIHELRILHRDIKPENILKNKNQIKIADFGLSKQLEDYKEYTQTRTPDIMAPEIIEGNQYSIQVDVYSLGVVMYYFLFGSYPFQMNNARLKTSEQYLKKKADLVQSQEIDFNYNGISISEELQNLVKDMLKFDPKERITMEQIWQHPLFQEQNQGLKRKISVSNIFTNQKIDNQQIAEFYKSSKIKDKQDFYISVDETPIFQQITVNTSQNKKLNQTEQLLIEKDNLQDIIQTNNQQEVKNKEISKEESFTLFQEVKKLENMPQIKSKIPTQIQQNQTISLLL